MFRFLIMLVALSLTACSNGVVRLYEDNSLTPAQLMHIDVPGELDIISINGERVAGVNNLFAITDRTLELAPGEYRISAFYHNVFDLGGDDIETIKTRPVMFVVDGEAGERLKLNFVAPANAEVARTMKENFSGWSSKADGSERRNTTPADRAYRQFSLSLSGGPGTETATTVAPYDADQADADGSVSTRADLMERLKANWQQATPEEREQFLQWVDQ